MVPKIASPFSASARNPSTFSNSHCSFPPEKYVAGGRPYYNAIVWQDTRTDRIASALDRDGRGDVIRQKAGLPPATY
ncbi:hypothetical protein C6A85_12800, partial [Mycobacterium sp. ITM-2017-0098]